MAPRSSWDSWSFSCRSEFPLLATASARYGRQVASLGVDVGDTTKNALPFLRVDPVSYPMYTGELDDLGSLTLNMGDVPDTVYISANGHIPYRHVGQYDSLDNLENDIQQYSLGVHG